MCNKDSILQKLPKFTKDVWYNEAKAGVTKKTTLQIDCILGDKRGVIRSLRSRLSFFRYAQARDGVKSPPILCELGLIGKFRHKFFVATRPALYSPLFPENCLNLQPEIIAPIAYRISPSITWQTPFHLVE
jgi:hypothetical protein